jgi:RNA polymerase sigma-70 factor (ECF subfamily)
LFVTFAATTRFPRFPSVRDFALENRVSAPVPATADPSDEFLLALTCEGDKDAMALLFKRYARIVRGVAYRVLRDPSEADDLLQEVFLLLHRLCPNFDPVKASARFWILQIAYRRAISRRRYLVSRHFYNTVDLEDLSECFHDGGNNSALNDNRLIAAEALREILPELSEDQRKTLHLHFYDGYTFKEIAAKLGQSVGNISNHYYRGLEKLRRHIFDGKLLNKRAR